MKTKFYISAALLGGLVIFVWSAFAHMALPWWNDVMRVMPNEEVVVDAIKSTGAPNGMYYGMQGFVLVTFFGKGMTDGAGMATPMIIEFISNVLLAWLLAWLLLKTHERSVPRLGLYAGAIGLAGWVAGSVSNWIWYNFPFGYVFLEAVDMVIATFLAGLVIGWIMKRQRTSFAEPTRARAAV